MKRITKTNHQKKDSCPNPIKSYWKSRKLFKGGHKLFLDEDYWEQLLYTQLECDNDIVIARYTWNNISNNPWNDSFLTKRAIKDIEQYHKWHSRIIGYDKVIQIFF